MFGWIEKLIKKYERSQTFYHGDRVRIRGGEGEWCVERSETHGRCWLSYLGPASREHKFGNRRLESTENMVLLHSHNQRARLYRRSWWLPPLD